MAILVAPLTLAGEQYGLYLPGPTEFSVEALVASASGFLLHGGALAINAAVLWTAAIVGRG